MLASTVSSKMLAEVAKVEGFKFTETLTGFKWLGNAAIDASADGDSVLFAFEEAIGFMVGDAVMDKDGISALAVLSENAIRLYNKGQTLYGYLTRLYKKYGWFVSNNSYYVCHEATVIKSIFSKMRTPYPSKIGEWKIVGVRDLTVGYDSSTLDKLPTLPVSASSEMITFKYVLVFTQA